MEHKEMNELLYHYTTLDALGKILSSNVFILSDFKNANDFRERVSFVSEQNKYKYISFHKVEINAHCFSNPVMWRYYAKRKTDEYGVCIAVDINKFLDKVIKHGCIQYRSGVLYIDDIIKRNDVLSYLMHKSHFWEYENEYRLIFKEGINEIEEFSDCIKEIYFDYDMEKSDVFKFTQLHSNRLSNCTFYRVYIDPDDGRINRIKVLMEGRK